VAKEPKIYLILPPDAQGPASNGLFTPAQLSYRVLPQGVLGRAKWDYPPRRGLMAAELACPLPSGCLPALAAQIFSQCMAEGHKGLLLDGSGDGAGSADTLAAALSPMLAKAGLPLYISRPVPQGVKAIPITAAAPLDGSTETLLRKAAAKDAGRGYGVFLPGRSHDFTLPGRGSGRRLSPRELKQTLQQSGARAYYSKELEAMYALYRQQGREQMLLWDTAQSFAARARRAISAGAAAVFIPWEDVSHLWATLAPLLQGLRPAKAEDDAHHG